MPRSPGRAAARSPRSARWRCGPSTRKRSADDDRPILPRVNGDGRAALEQIVREESGLVLAALIASCGDFDLADGAFQDAVAVARSFLVPEATMAKRLERAKHKIRAAQIPFRVPAPDAWFERVQSVLAVIYLIFNAGYSATGASRDERCALCAEGIRLARILAALLPGEGEVHALHALVLLHDARRDARIGGD